MTEIGGNVPVVNTIDVPQEPHWEDLKRAIDHGYTPDLSQVYPELSMADYEHLHPINLSILHPPAKLMIHRKSTSEKHELLMPSPMRNPPGLGNLLFQFSAIWGLSETEDNPHDVVIDAYHFRDFLAIFDLRNWLVTDKTDVFYAFPIYNCSSYTPTYAEALKGTIANISIPGYLQSWKFFHPRNVDSLSSVLKVRPSISNKASAVLESIVQKVRPGVPREEVVTVGIHVRRGDIIQVAHHVSHGHVPASEAYFRLAMGFFRDKFPKVVFAVVSNDIPWCKETFGDVHDVGFVEYDGDFSGAERAGIDMITLAFCDHMIQSVGTFSWWAAYLHKLLVKNGKEQHVFYYKDWPKRGSTFAQQLRPEDYFLPGWIPL